MGNSKLTMQQGRRFLLNLSFPNMAWTLLAAGLCLRISPERTSLRLGFFIFFVLLFMVAYSPGEGPVAFTVSSEVFPLVNREVGMSFAVSATTLSLRAFSYLVSDWTRSSGTYSVPASWLSPFLNWHTPSGIPAC